LLLATDAANHEGGRYWGRGGSGHANHYNGGHRGGYSYGGHHHHDDYYHHPHRGGRHWGRKLLQRVRGL
jgi:hypothetical protein